jgi:hypothetical protein
MESFNAQKVEAFSRRGLRDAGQLVCQGRGQGSLRRKISLVRVFRRLSMKGEFGHVS